MIASDQLFKLIKSLNKQEKRYFKLFSGIHREESTYTLLFDFINKQKEYNEVTIKKHFRSEKFIEQLPVAKHNLYKAILKSMNQYHSEHSVELMLKDLLFSVEFQFEKTLYEGATKSLNKAKDLATIYEKHELLLRILKWEKKLMNVSNSKKNNLEEAKKIFEQEHESFNKLNNSSQYSLLHKEIALIVSAQAHLRTEKQKKEVQKLLEHPLLKNINQALTFESKTFFYQIQSYYFRLMEDNEKSNAYRETLLKLWEDYPHFIKENPTVYIPIVQNLMNVQLDKRMYDTFNNTSDKLKKLKPNSEADKLLLFLAYYPGKLTYYINTLKSEDAYIITEAEENFEQFELKLREDHVMLFYYLFSLSHFMNGNFKSSLRWINTIFNNMKLETRPDIGSAILLMNLIVHFELKNFDHMDYIVKSTYRSLLKMERLYEFEKTILLFLRELPVNNSQKEVLAAFEKLKNQLKVLESNPYENKAFKYFDFTSWLESKIENVSFASIVIKKAK